MKQGKLWIKDLRMNPKRSESPSHLDVLVATLEQAAEVHLISSMLGVSCAFLDQLVKGRDLGHRKV